MGWYFLFPLFSDCPDGFIACNNFRCIPEAYLCDGHDDCGDLTDESPRFCCEFQSSRALWNRCYINAFNNILSEHFTPFIKMHIIHAYTLMASQRWNVSSREIYRVINDANMIFCVDEFTNLFRCVLLWGEVRLYDMKTHTTRICKLHLSRFFSCLYMKKIGSETIYQFFLSQMIVYQQSSVSLRMPSYVGTVHWNRCHGNEFKETTWRMG